MGKIKIWFDHFETESGVHILQIRSTHEYYESAKYEPQTPSQSGRTRFWFFPFSLIIAYQKKTFLYMKTALYKTSQKQISRDCAAKVYHLRKSFSDRFYRKVEIHIFHQKKNWIKKTFFSGRKMILKFWHFSFTSKFSKILI